MEAQKRRCLAIAGDIRDPQHCRALVTRMVKELGAIDVLVNNAGYQMTHQSFVEMKPDEIDRVFRTNVYAMFYLTQAAVPHMKPGATIVNSASIQAYQPKPYLLHYASSKAAVSCFTEALAHQLVAAGTQVRAAVFYPSGGLLDTGLWTAQRNRPPELARQKPRPPAPGTTFEEFKQLMEQSGREVNIVDVVELGRFVLQQIKEGKFVIGHDLERAGDLLHARADAIAKGELPPTMAEGF